MMNHIKEGGPPSSQTSGRKDIEHQGVGSGHGGNVMDVFARCGLRLSDAQSHQIYNIAEGAVQKYWSRISVDEHHLALATTIGVLTAIAGTAGGLAALLKIGQDNSWIKPDDTHAPMIGVPPFTIFPPETH